MKKNQIMLYFSWVVALIATLGSLYFSEIKQFIPCELCWYQRIFMYPLVLILGIGTFYQDICEKICATNGIYWLVYFSLSLSCTKSAWTR